MLVGFGTGDNRLTFNILQDDSQPSNFMAKMLLVSTLDGRRTCASAIYMSPKRCANCMGNMVTRVVYPDDEI
jgi:hypothetical protein